MFNFSRQHSGGRAEKWTGSGIISSDPHHCFGHKFSGCYQTATNEHNNRFKPEPTDKCNADCLISAASTPARGLRSGADRAAGGMREPGGTGTGGAGRGRRSQRVAESEEQGSEGEPEPEQNPQKGTAIA